MNQRAFDPAPVTSQGDATRMLADFVAHTRYEDLPESVVAASKRIILDTIGCALGALNTTPGLAVRKLAESGGGDEASVLGTGCRTTTFSAAYANGRLANILDFDECYMVQGHHAQATLATALALCEQAGRNGKELITAFAVGFEVGIRFGNFLTPRVSVGVDGKANGWTGLAGPGQGVYAACAAAAYLWGLPPERIRQAFGLCAQYMVGRDWSRQWGRDPDLGTIKYADTGWNAQGGMMAAFGAGEGLTGIQDIFDRDSYAEIFRGAILDRAALVQGIGERWSVQDTSIKFWPCCRWIHYALTAYADLLQEHALTAEEIDAVELLSFPMIPYPCFSSREPTNLVAATFSFPHAAAMVALNIPAGPEWFATAQMNGKRAQQFRNRVSLKVDPTGEDPSTWGRAEGVLKVPSRARIKARGKHYERKSSFALGDPWPGAPRYGDDELKEKFRHQTQGVPAGSERWHQQVEAIIDQTLNLEQHRNVREFVRGIQMPSFS